MLMTGGVPSADPFQTECKNRCCCNVNVVIDCKQLQKGVSEVQCHNMYCIGADFVRKVTWYRWLISGFPGDYHNQTRSE